jgi:hypothetical protein
MASQSATVRLAAALLALRITAPATRRPRQRFQLHRSEELLGRGGRWCRWAVYEWTFRIGPGVFAGIANGLILGWLMYRSGLVPPRFALFGLVGGPLVSIVGLLVILDVVRPRARSRCWWPRSSFGSWGSASISSSRATGVRLRPWPGPSRPLSSSPAWPAPSRPAQQPRATSGTRAGGPHPMSTTLVVSTARRGVIDAAPSSLPGRLGSVIVVSCRVDGTCQ